MYSHSKDDKSRHNNCFEQNWYNVIIKHEPAGRFTKEFLLYLPNNGQETISVSSPCAWGHLILSTSTNNLHHLQLISSEQDLMSTYRNTKPSLHSNQPYYKNIHNYKFCVVQCSSTGAVSPRTAIWRLNLYFDSGFWISFS